MNWFEAILWVVGLHEEEEEVDEDIEKWEDEGGAVLTEVAEEEE